MLWMIEFSSNEASLVNGLTMCYRNTAADARISPIVRACVCVYAEVLQLLAEIENGFLFANFCAPKQAVLVKLKLACNPKPSLLPPAALQFQPKWWSGDQLGVVVVPCTITFNQSCVKEAYEWDQPLETRTYTHTHAHSASSVARGCCCYWRLSYSCVKILRGGPKSMVLEAKDLPLPRGREVDYFCS